MRLRTSFRREAAPEDLAHLHEVVSAAGACGDAGKTAQDDRAIYQPFQLMGRKIILSDETLGAISQFEIFASRCDCTIGTSPLGPSLSRTLARMDGIFVALLNGRPRRLPYLLLPRLSEGSRRLDKRRSRQGKG